MGNVMALKVVGEGKSGDAAMEEVPTHDALELTKAGKVATITLAGKQYTLRITKAVKLILTK
jgi:hypothetical protein